MVGGMKKPSGGTIALDNASVASLLAGFDRFQDPAVSRFVDDGSDSDAGRFGIADAQTRGRCHQAFDDAIVVFVEHDQARERGTFLALITERGINRIDDRFVEVGIGIDDDGVLAAHLADDAFEFALPGPGFAGALPDSQSNFARAGEGDHVDILVIDQVRADDASPCPGRKLSTPGGTPASSNISINIAPQTADCSAGFIITVLPVTSAAETMPQRIAMGKFQGAMTRATPRGQ